MTKRLGRWGGRFNFLCHGPYIWQLRPSHLDQPPKCHTTGNRGKERFTVVGNPPPQRPSLWRHFASLGRVIAGQKKTQTYLFLKKNKTKTTKKQQHLLSLLGEVEAAGSLT